MDYMNIVLAGYYKGNTRKHLDKYFLREFKKAVQEYFDPEEFYDGCKGALDVLEGDIQAQVSNRTAELKLMLEHAKNRTLRIGSMESGKTYEESCMETVANCENEINAINPNDWYANLHSLTEGRMSGQLRLSEIRSIHEQLKIAYLKVGGSILQAEKKPPAKYYALYHWILIVMGREKPFEPDENDKLPKAQIEAYATERFPGISSQQFYKAFKDIDITDKMAIARNFGTGYKDVIAEISENDSQIIHHLKAFPR